MKKIMSFVTGAIMGGLVGATIAILMAPSSGDDLRGDMRQRFSKFQDELSEAASARKAELEKRFADLKNPQKSMSVE